MEGVEGGAADECGLVFYPEVLDRVECVGEDDALGVLVGLLTATVGL